MRIIDEKLLSRFRGPGFCDWCKKYVRGRHPHHLWRRGIGGAWRMDLAINLAALCYAFQGGDNCHERAHSGEILRCDLLAIVAAREGVQQADIEREMWRLRRTTDGTPASDLSPLHPRPGLFLPPFTS